MKFITLSKTTLGFCALSFFSMVTSCKKDKNITPDPIDPVIKHTGVYVLNEGGMDHNSSSLSFYNFESKTVINDVFSLANPNQQPLGDVGQDIKIYGSKMYILMNASSKIEVVDAQSVKSIKAIPMGTAPQLKLPRAIVFYGGNGFVSSTDGTVSVVDTASLTITKTISVGRNPDGMAIVGNKLYVANSGAYDLGNYDNTISVIDLTSLTEIKKITVAVNLGKVVADQYGDVYVISQGNYVDIKSNLYVIDTKTDAVKKQFDIEVTNLEIYKDKGYLFSYDYTANQAVYHTINVKDETVLNNSFITDLKGNSIVMPYGLAINPKNGDIYVSDAKDFSNSGIVYCFNADGVLQFNFTAGQIPSHFAFYNQ